MSSVSHTLSWNPLVFFKHLLILLFVALAIYRPLGVCRRSCSVIRQTCLCTPHVVFPAPLQTWTFLLWCLCTHCLQSRPSHQSGGRGLPARSWLEFHAIMMGSVQTLSLCCPCLGELESCGILCYIMATLSGGLGPSLWGSPETTYLLPAFQ